MASSISDPTFVIWGIDKVPYGPVELPTLVSWVKDERVTADTWIFVGQTGEWLRADTIPELQMFFGPRTRAASGAAVANPNASARGMDILKALHQIRILSSFNDAQLERFAAFIEVQRVPQWQVIVRQGDAGDSMFFILEGELRVRINPMGKETILATLSPGDFFGDISLFDHGPRSADVVANKDSVVARFSSVAFEQLSKDAPELATPFLRGIGKTLTARIRADNKKIGDAFKFNLAAQ